MNKWGQSPLNLLLYSQLQIPKKTHPRNFSSRPPRTKNVGLTKIIDNIR